MTTKNLFHQFIEALGIQHTSDFTDGVFEKHPYKYTLYGISRMLDYYRIPSTGIRLTEKEKLSQIDVPFIAQISNDLVVVEHIDDSTVSYNWYGERVKVDKSDFCSSWSGAALIAIPDTSSCEPEYKRHRLNSFLKQIRKHIPELSLIFILCCLFFTGYRPGPLQTAVAVCYAVGGCFSYLLLLQQMRIRSTLSDRVCHLLKHSSCRNVLESPAAHIPGGFTWSEAGLAYFITSALVTIFFNKSLSILAILSIGTLGYACWSIWYQKFRAGAWCPLCLAVQGVQLVIFFLFLSGGIYTSLHVNLIPALILFACYATALSVINRLSSMIAKTNKAKAREQAYEDLKLRKEVFEALLYKQPSYPSDETASCLLFGNPEAPHTITVFSNPFCNPCAAMHKRLHVLPGRRCNVRYILTYFNDKLSFANERLISAYMHYGPDKAWDIFGNWFDGGKTTPEKFFGTLESPASDYIVDEEMERHRKWKDTTKLMATPTILFDGYVLPQPYTVEDLIHFVS